MEIRIIKAEDYKYYEELLVTLYIDTFSSGESFQYHNKEKTQNYLQSIFEVGYGIFAIKKNQLAAAILLTPISFDSMLPKDIAKGFNLNRSIYIAEMMVEKTSQGRGIGKKLLLHFLENVDKKTYTDAFIRVWLENKAALGLYKKVGFKTCSSIVQPKLLADKSGIFDFKKLYLHQKLK